MNPTETASDAVKRLFECYADDVYQYVRFTLGSPTEAEDVVQDVFLEALRAWPRFAGRSSEGTWLWAIVRHRLADHMRRRRRERTEPGAQLAEPETVTVDDAATRLDLQRCLQRLPLAQRQVFILRIVQDKSSAETSQLLGWSDVKVRVTLHRALKALSQFMQVPQVPGKGGAGSDERI